MITLNDSHMRIPISVELHIGINVIIDDSGTGKTFLFSLIQSYCVGHGISCVIINSSNIEAGVPTANCEILLLDNADLYADKDFLSKCCSKSRYILCSAKLPLEVDSAKIYMCSLKNNNGTLEVRPYNVYI